MTDEATTGRPDANPVPAPSARVIYGREHEKLVPLEWPVEFDGITYTEIRVHRVSGKEVSDYLRALQASDADILPPMIDCPIEVWNALDADDHDTVDRAAIAFTPKRLKAIFDAATVLDTAATPTA